MDRKIRKQWLLSEFGDGTVVLCAFGCGTHLTYETITVDRYPIPGAEGGTYKRDNIRPACDKCNTADGSKLGHARKAAKHKADY